MAGDFDWRALINSAYNEIDDLQEDGSSPPAIEVIEPKKRGRKAQPRFQVQKIITEVIVYTDMSKHQFGEKTFQHIVMFGEMTQGKLEKLIKEEIDSHQQEE